MKRAVLALALVACTATRPPLDAATGQESALDLSFAVQVAAAQCTANAAYESHTSPYRAQGLVDECLAALIPARDAVVFVLPGAQKWNASSGAAVGCAGLTVSAALTRVRATFNAHGFTSTPAIETGIRAGQRVSPYAGADCDPLHPTSETKTFVDPHIANVQPEYPSWNSP